MMRRIILAASVLLLIQIGLVVTLHINGSKTESSAVNTQFIAMDPDKVTNLTVSGTEEQQLVLENTDKGWILPNSYGAAADGSRIEELLQKLATVKQGLAVATSPEAAKRFKTAEDDFERHLVINEGGRIVADVYLGTSAGFRYSHVRKSDQDEITTIPVSSFEVEVKADQWLDKNQVHLKKEDVQKISLGDILLTRQEKNWLLSGVEPAKVKTDEVEKLLDKVSAVPVQSVLNPDDVSPLFDKEPAIRCTVNMTDNSEVVFTFVKSDDHHVLKTSNSDLYFKVNNWLVESLTGFTLESLTLKEEKGAPQENQAEEAQAQPQGGEKTEQLNNPAEEIQETQTQTARAE